MPLPFCVYVLLSLRDRKFYIGYTTNLAQRLKNHHDGKTRSTAPRRPLVMLFCEFYLSRQDAQRRERYFKTTAGKKGLRLMIRQTIAERILEA